MSLKNVERILSNGACGPRRQRDHRRATAAGWMCVSAASVRTLKGVRWRTRGERWRAVSPGGFTALQSILDND